MKLSTQLAEAKLLRRALLGNAAFSAICGVAIVLFDARLVGLMTNFQHRLWPLGLMLLAFAASLLWFSTRPAISSAWVASVILADMTWVVGTVALFLGGHALLTAAGLWILAVVGTFVFGFAELQWLGLRHLKRAAT